MPVVSRFFMLILFLRQLSGFRSALSIDTARDPVLAV